MLYYTQIAVLFILRTGGKNTLNTGFAEKPEVIRGQSFHPVTNEVELICPAEKLTSQQVHEFYGEMMAGLSELLDFGINNPNVQRHFPIAILWQDEHHQFWSAILDSCNDSRELLVLHDEPEIEWHSDYRFLIK